MKVFPFVSGETAHSHFAAIISQLGLRHLACAAVIAAGLACALAQQIADMGAAREYCDTHPLDRIEGIWDLTDADTQVLIARSEEHDGEYVMTVITSGDCRLLPGDTLGIYRRTPDGDRFRLTMTTGLKINAECVATLTEDDMGITIQRPVHRIELSPHLCCCDASGACCVTAATTRLTASTTG